MLVDTHAHFKAGEGLPFAEASLTRAYESGISTVIVVGGSHELNNGAINIAGKLPGKVPVALGLDRSQACGISTAGELDSAVNGLRRRIQECRAAGIPVVAVGEIGLDYHYEADSGEAQKRLFGAQLMLADELSLPVIVHSREADDDTLEIISRYASTLLRSAHRTGVLHCYTGSLPFAQELLKRGMMISFSGIVTFRNAAELRTTASVLPLDSLLVETDSPYLAPVPLRGKRNEPANVRLVAEALADLRGISRDRLFEATTANARRLFQLD